MEVSEILEQADIAEYISQYTDGYEEKSGELWCISPLNPSEKTPSFSIRPGTNCFFDFSTGQGGNLLEFVKLHDHCSLMEAIARVKEFFHIDDGGEGAGEAHIRLTASSVAKKFRAREPARSKVTAGILPPDYMERFPFDKRKLKAWADEGISYEVMARYGVRYDPVDNRIVYPIKNTAGEIFCVSGRTCDPLWKEKKLRKYTYTSSIGALPCIYALSDHLTYIKEQKEIILFEGCKSVLKMATWGFENTGALLTSHLSESQMSILIKLASFSGVRVVFALDSDVDITADRYICQLKHYATVEWVHNTDDLLQVKDSPVDRGLDIWQTLYAGRIRI